MEIKINMYKDIHLLKFIFPNIKINSYGYIIFRTADSLYDFSGSELTLVQDVGGFNLLTQKGLILFLKHIQFLKNDTLDRFSKIQIKGITELYKLISKYRIKLFSLAGEDDQYQLDIFQLPIRDRLEAVFNGEIKLKSILKILNQTFDSSTHRFLNPFYVKKLFEFKSKVLKHEVLKVELSGNDLMDTLQLVLCIRSF